MNRTCPNCKEQSIPAIRLLRWSTICKECGAKVGINELWGFIIFVPLFMVYLFLLLWSLGKYGIYGPVVVTIFGVIMEMVREMITPLHVRALPKKGL